MTGEQLQDGATTGGNEQGPMIRHLCFRGHSKDPTGIYRDSVKRPDGVTLGDSQAGPWSGMSRLQQRWQIPTSQLLV